MRATESFIGMNDSKKVVDYKLQAPERRDISLFIYIYKAVSETSSIN